MKIKDEGERMNLAVNNHTSVIHSKRWFVSQEELNDWLDRIAAARNLIAPRDVSGVVLYRRVGKSSEIAETFTRPVLSVKEIFFPSTEQLFTIQKTGQEIHIEETFPGWETVVFGVRPCDARGVQLLDAVFLDTNPVDAFYARRRENTTLIGLACKKMGESCFCTSTGGAPDSADGVDIMLYETDGGYLAEAVTEKGRFLIPGSEWKETMVEPKPIETRGRFPVPERGVWTERFNDAYWAKMSERCLSCRACAYVCPTCRCFAVRDEMVKPGEFERIRCWDACAGENYRRVAGGHKPRAEKSERLRNRFFCKFFYYPEQYGLGEALACTGCGRCIDICPAGVDITEVLTDLERIA
jgi:sulfhydrogenase subunit beta (sulfur reductase)